MQMQLGLVSADFLANQMPGWKPLSWGYHGDDGNKYSNGSNTAYGPVFTTGDIVGCGVNNISGQIFFTKNGMLLGNAFDKGTRTSLKPTERDCLIYLNSNTYPSQ